MNNTINDGGAAFPMLGSVAHNADWQIDYGMTLRDYFAAKAMSGLCANPGGPFQSCDQSGWTLVNCTLDQVAGMAYEMADAMLKARQA